MEKQEPAGNKFGRALTLGLCMALYVWKACLFIVDREIVLFLFVAINKFHPSSISKIYTSSKRTVNLHHWSTASVH